MASSQLVPELSRRERRKREVRERILSVAMARFVLQGFDDTTVDQIAEDADVAQKTFFNYFPSKQRLLSELAEARIDELQEILGKERERAGATRAKLDQCFLRLSALLESRGLFARDLVLVLQRARQPGEKGEGLSRMHAAFGAILRDGQECGDVRMDHSIEFLTEMVVGGFCAVMNNWVNIGDYPVKDRMAQAAAFLGEAVSPPANVNLEKREAR
jgi:AcrR family transcriptional regulator